MSRPPKTLSVYVDGAARGNPGPAGVGIILAEGNARPIKEIACFVGEATNNVAESMALIVALQEALKIHRRRIDVFTDSELLVRQINGDYRVKDKELKWLHVLIRNLIQGLERFEIHHIPREKNRRADRLANKAVTEGLKRQPPSRKKKNPVPAVPQQPTFW